MNEPTTFEKYMADVQRLATNSLDAFQDEGVSGFHKLSIYRATLSGFYKTSKKMLDDFNASLTLEERIKFDAAESAFSDEGRN